MMKKYSLVVAFVSALVVNAPVFARDTKLMLPIASGISQPEAVEKLGSTIKFYFGQQAHPAVEKSSGSFPTNKKTNSANKSDEEACNWAFLSALIALRDRAVSEGGNAVINIQSYYMKNATSSETEFECHAGTFVTGVALTGEVVKLK